jgi:predicted TPR repeat methyltransferase
MFLKFLGNALKKRPRASGAGAAGKPAPQENSALRAAQIATLLDAGRFSEMEAAARALTVETPQLGNGWKALGTALMAQERPADAIAPLQRAAQLAAGDADTFRYLGIALQQQGRIADAETSYRRALELSPDLADVHGNLANVLNELRRYPEAEASGLRAAALTPGDARLHLILGTAQMSQGKLAEAEANYRRALKLSPDFAAAYNYLGVVLGEQSRFAESEASCLQALALRPNLAGAHNILGIAQMKQNRVDEAEASFRRALDANPDYAAAFSNLSDLLRVQGRSAEALECYRRVMDLDPENDVALHWVLALSGSKVESAPAKYVSAVFDNYAKTFDAHITGPLQYRVPELLAALAAEYWPAREGGLDILDLGCGTGLVGAAVAAHVRQLAGVDLSAKMLEQARARNIYTRLEQTDLLEMTRAEADASYDAIFAADVFIYVGRFDGVVEQVKRLLRPGGVFAFSIESLDALQMATAAGTKREVQLLPSARFAHSSAYLQRLQREHGFAGRHFSPVAIRLEREQPIQGWLVVWSV